MDSISILPQAKTDEGAYLTRLVGRLALLLGSSEIETVLGWDWLTPPWREVFGHHRRWAHASKDGIVDGGDQE